MFMSDQRHENRRTLRIGEKSELYVTRVQKWSCGDYHEGPRTTSGLVGRLQKHSGNRPATQTQPLFPSHCNGSPQNYNFRSTLTSYIKLWIKIGGSGAHSIVNCRSRNLNREKEMSGHTACRNGIILSCLQNHPKTHMKLELSSNECLISWVDRSPSTWGHPPPPCVQPHTTEFQLLVVKQDHFHGLLLTNSLQCQNMNQEKSSWQGALLTFLSSGQSFTRYICFLTSIFMKP